MDVTPSLSVTLVTFDSANDLGRCLDSLAAQTCEPLEVVVVDNASSDDSAEVAQRHRIVTRVLRNAENRGFAAGQNQAIREARGDWILVLNPDVTLESGFVEVLCSHLDEPAPLGSLCGKLMRAREDGTPQLPALFDSTGIVFDRSWRHFDRGSQERDTGQFDRTEAVFGGTGAATCYRREMVHDISVEGEFFDEAFFAYREDADVAWRAQLRGWDCLYEPRAVGYHIRRVLPRNRRQVPSLVNRHSVKNRFLMRIKNADGSLILHCGFRGILRDLLVLAGCLTVEWRSLPAFADILRLAPRTLRHRRAIQGHRLRDATALARWFV